MTDSIDNQDAEPSGRGRYARRPGPRKRVVTVNVQMPPELLENIDKAATADGKDSRSEWVREACEEKLHRRVKRQGRERGQDAPHGKQAGDGSAD